MRISRDGATLQQYLEEIEAKIAAKQHQIDEQREVIVKLESAGRTADHAKYLLAGLQLLQAAYRDSGSGMLAEVVEVPD
jgi:cell division protein FtsL